MARAFRRRRGAIVARLDAAERELLASTFAQTAQLLRSTGPSEPASPPDGGEQDEFDRLVAGVEAALDGPGDDPALQRLLPDAHRDDPIASAAFRRRAGDGVREGKIARLETALGALASARGDDLVLDEPAAQAFLVALTDVRLVLGERLGMRTESDVESLESELARAGDDDPRMPLVVAYDFLTWLQETLAGALLP